MNIDDHLRKFRPAEPPPALRARVLAAAAVRGRRRIPWRLAAALLIGVALVAVNAGLERRLTNELGPGESTLADSPSVLGARSLPGVFARLAPRPSGGETTWAVLRIREL